MHESTSTWSPQAAEREQAENGHWRALDRALRLAAADGARAPADPRWRASMVICKRAADRRLGAGGINSVAERFLSHKGWLRCLLMRDLFHDYVDAGLIDTQKLKTVTQHVCSPLEWAVLFSNADAFRCYLEAGSDPGAVPTRGLKESASVFSVAVHSLSDIEQMIEQVPADALTTLDMLSAMTQWRMTRCIGDDLPSPAQASSPDDARGRRAL